MQLTKVKLLEIHTQKLEENCDNKSNTDSLLNALGGIDNILSLLLSSSDTELNTDQLAKIHDIINSASSPKTEEDKCCICISKLFKKQEPETLYYFSRSNTFIHSLFDDERAQKLFNIPYSKYSVIILGFMGLIFFITRQNVDSSLVSPLISNICQPIAQFYSLIWALLLLLTVNKRAFKAITGHFEFWFKLLYVIQYVIGEWMLYFVSDDKYQKFYNAPILRTIVVPLTLCIISLFDGFQLKLWIKIVCGVTSGIAFSSVAIYYTCLSLELFGHRDDSTIYIEQIGVEISIFNFMANALQIVSLFIWKQTIYAIIYRDRCAIISSAPYLKWFDIDVNNKHAIQSNIELNGQNNNTYTEHDELEERIGRKQMIEIEETTNNDEDDSIGLH